MLCQFLLPSPLLHPAYLFLLLSISLCLLLLSDSLSLLLSCSFLLGPSSFLFLCLLSCPSLIFHASLQVSGFLLSSSLLFLFLPEPFFLLSFLPSLSLQLLLQLSILLELLNVLWSCDSQCHRHGDASHRWSSSWGLLNIHGLRNGSWLTCNHHLRLGLWMLNFTLIVLLLFLDLLKGLLSRLLLFTHHVNCDFLLLYYRLCRLHLCCLRNRRKDSLRLGFGWLNHWLWLTRCRFRRMDWFNVLHLWLGYWLWPWLDHYWFWFWLNYRLWFWLYYNWLHLWLNHWLHSWLDNFLCFKSLSLPLLLHSLLNLLLSHSLHFLPYLLFDSPPYFSLDIHQRRLGWRWLHYNRCWLYDFYHRLHRLWLNCLWLHYLWLHSRLLYDWRSFDNSLGNWFLLRLWYGIWFRFRLLK